MRTVMYVPTLSPKVTTTLLSQFLGRDIAHQRAHRVHWWLLVSPSHETTEQACCESVHGTAMAGEWEGFWDAIQEFICHPNPNPPKLGTGSETKMGGGHACDARSAQWPPVMPSGAQ